MQNIIDALENTLSAEIVVAIISMIPIIELRGAIPIGVALGLSPLSSTIISFFASLIPAPFILVFIKAIFDFLSKNPRFKKFIDKITTRSLEKNQDKINKYGFIGLILIVAIPLPGTGVWSGSLIASLLNMKFKWAMPAIIIGNAIAAVLVMLIVIGVLSLF